MGRDGQGWAGQPVEERQQRRTRGKEGARGQESLSVEREQPAAQAPHPSISLARTGYLGNLCSLIIT